jgi:hypothetical protein
MKNFSLMHGAVLALILLGGAIEANAAATAPKMSLSPGVAAMPDIGKVMQTSPPSAGTFRVDATTGNVSVIGGTLTRVSGASVAVPTYTVICINGSAPSLLCGSTFTQVTVTVSNPVAVTGAAITAFNVAISPGVGTTGCSPAAGQNTTNLSFVCQVVNAGTGINNPETVATVRVGMDINVPAVATTGRQNPSYTISTVP